jgi:hypothetical protein
MVLIRPINPQAGYKELFCYVTFEIFTVVVKNFLYSGM